LFSFICGKCASSSTRFALLGVAPGTKSTINENAVGSPQMFCSLPHTDCTFLHLSLGEDQLQNASVQHAAFDQLWKAEWVIVVPRNVEIRAPHVNLEYFVDDSTESVVLIAENGGQRGPTIPLVSSECFMVCFF
jgi:hypothetical protein